MPFLLFVYDIFMTCLDSGVKKDTCQIGWIYVLYFLVKTSGIVLIDRILREIFK